MLAEHAHLATYSDYGVPIIYAGNQDCRAEVERIFQDNGVDIRVTANVMPESQRLPHRGRQRSDSRAVPDGHHPR
jgi:hypothetical protein